MTNTDADIAIVTVIPEEYAAVHELLQAPIHDPGTSTLPNLFAWEVGTLSRSTGGEYRVALAMAARAGTLTCSQAIIQTAERWNPRYILLLGIAGGLAREEQSLGDVVVSSVIYGYEYGKVDGTFIPRHHWVYHPDDALFASALRFSTVDVSWSSTLSLHPAAKPPRALPGVVASGEKIVDDPTNKFFKAVTDSFPGIKAVEMEGVGAATAIDVLRAKGRVIGFIMVRGISDLPKAQSERKKTGKLALSAQTKERDATKVFAARTAAAFAVRWISEAWPVPPKFSSPGTPPQGSLDTASTKQDSAPKQRGPSKATADPVEAYRPEDSTPFFHDRMCDAFPGKMGSLLVETPAECVVRLQELLKKPLAIGMNPPIWEVGHGTMGISSFKVLEGSTVLLGHERFKVSKIFAYRSLAYWKDFVLMYWDAEDPTGLYPPLSADELAHWMTTHGGYTEEYGVWGKKLVTRQEYDDGSTLVANKPKRISARLEVRHLTAGATFLVGQRSALNDLRFDLERWRLLNGLLQGSVTHEQLVAWVESLPKHRREDD